MLFGCGLGLILLVVGGGLATRLGLGEEFDEGGTAVEGTVVVLGAVREGAADPGDEADDGDRHGWAAQAVPAPRTTIAATVSAATPRRDRRAGTASGCGMR